MGSGGRRTRAELTLAGDARPAPAAQALARIQGSPPLLGPYYTYQVPVADIISLTYLAMPDLAKEDILASPQAVGDADGHRQLWIELVDTSEIQV